MSNKQISRLFLLKDSFLAWQGGDWVLVKESFASWCSNLRLKSLQVSLLWAPLWPLVDSLNSFFNRSNPSTRSSCLVYGSTLAFPVPVVAFLVGQVALLLRGT